MLLVIAPGRGGGQDFVAHGVLKIEDISADTRYGYAEKKSIKVGNIENQQYYLNALLGPNGEPITYFRIGSCCPFRSKRAAFGKGYLDIYHITYEGIKAPIRLFLNGYDYEKPKAPHGLTFTTEAGASDTRQEPDVASAALFCDRQNLYTADHFLLKSKIGDLKIPESRPVYSSGMEGLRDHFADKKLSDKRAENIVFRVAIGFLVNCNGEAGDFQVISEGKDDMDELARQVLDIVRSVHGDWVPASANEKAVDCYQVLSFTVVNGELGKVSYKE